MLNNYLKSHCFVLQFTKKFHSKEHIFLLNAVKFEMMRYLEVMYEL